MAAQLELIDDVATEIFLRLPPDEPEHLIRAFLVCKPWFRLLTDPGFLRCYRAFHRTPPLLGYIPDYIPRLHLLEANHDPRLIPITTVPLTPNPSFIRAIDCHHGRVLLRAVVHDRHLVVWDPVTGVRKIVPEPGITWTKYSSAVFRAVSGCDHLDCHGGPFRVALVATGQQNGQVKACVYSSETGTWSTPVILGDGCETYAWYMKDAMEHVGTFGMLFAPCIQHRRGAIIGDGLYVTLRSVMATAIVKYDLGKNCLSMIDPPSRDEHDIALMEMEDGTLGFACIQGWNLYLWSRNISSEGAAEWVQSKVIELEGMIPIVNPDDKAIVVGPAEGVGVIFVSADVALFSVELDSGRVRKLGELGHYSSVVPYMSFYTPDCGKTIAFKGEDSSKILVPLN